MSKLSGKAILVIEDEFLISRMLVDALTQAEAIVVGRLAISIPLCR